MEALGFVLLALGIIAFLVWLAVRQQRRGRANLAALAQRRGLHIVSDKRAFGFDDPRAEGVQDGRAVRVWTFQTGSGKSRQTWLAAAVQPRQAGELAFDLQPQGLMAKLSELFGAKEIQVGDPRFDDAWFVRTNAPQVFGAALVPEIREKLMAARAAGAKGHFQLEQGWVRYVEPGHLSSDEAVRRLERVFPVLSDLADAAEVCASAPRA